MRSALRVGATAALLLPQRAGALNPGPAQYAPTARALTLSPHSFDGDSGLLQLDVKVSFAPPGSRMVVAFRCAPRGAAQHRTQRFRARLLPRSSTESAPVADSCMFEQVLLATGEQVEALTAAVNSSTEGASGDCAASGQCAPSLSSTCGFAVQRIQADSSSRFSGHVQVWLDDGAQVARVFSGAVALQVPLVSLMVALGGVKPLKCIILVWCLALVCCVLTPIKWWALHRPPPPPLAPYSFQPPPSLPPPGPIASLYSTLQLCSAQDDLAYLQQSRTGDTIFAGETYCLAQMVYNLPMGATLLEHALYQNGTRVPTAAGTHARLLLQPWPPAVVQFPYTFPAVGLVLLESVSVFRLAGENITTASGGGRQRVSASWALPPLSALADSSPAIDVRITQRAEFDLSAAALLPRKLLTVAAPAEQAILSASLATAQFVTRAAAPKRENLGSFVSL